MEDQDKTDLQLWEYIDGTCSDAERSRVSQLIANDALWGSRYRELSAFNVSIVSELELEQPSMRFTKNVMDVVAASAMAPAVSRYINPAIIKGIAAFFLISIAIVMGAVLFSVKWNTMSVTAMPHVHLPEVHLPEMHLAKHLSSTVINIAIAANVVVGLVFGDMMLRKRSRVKHS